MPFASPRNLPGSVLVVEDDYFIAQEISQSLSELGVKVIGPAASIQSALSLAEAEHVDFAILDINLRGELVFPVAEALRKRGCPFGFVTGYDVRSVPADFHDAVVMEKPIERDQIASLWRGVFNAEQKADDVAASNKLLNAIPAHVLDRLLPEMTRVDLLARGVLCQAQHETKRVYFPESGFCSVMMRVDQREIETGMIGREGMVGGWLLDCVERAPSRVIVQAAGVGFVIAADRFMAIAHENVELRRVVRRFNQAFSLQIASTAAANAALRVDERLARWLLMCSDRLGPELNIVHDFLAMMLDVRRSGVTEVLQALEAGGAIKRGRGRIEIFDREKLIVMTRGAYGVAEATLDKLLEGVSAAPVQPN